MFEILSGYDRTDSATCLSPISTTITENFLFLLYHRKISTSQRNENRRYHRVKFPRKFLIEIFVSFVFSDTPQSPESIQPIASPLVCPDLDHLFEQMIDQSLETRLELCMLYSLSSNKHRTISFCIETLIYLHENFSSLLTWKDCLIISSDYSFLPPSYPLLFNYLLDLLLEHLPPTLILLQFKSSTYPSNLFSTLTPLSLRYIYDQKLLGQFLHYIQTTSKSDRRWLSNTNKRKLDSEQNKLTDEQMIEKIIQHVSHITQWTDEQRRSAIYTYILDERQTLQSI